MSKVSKKCKDEKPLWFDFFDFSEKQVKVSIIMSVLLEGFVMFEIYKNFHQYIDMIKDLLLEILGGYIGLLGFTLSGIAIITALFSKENFDTIQASESIQKLFSRNIDRFFYLTKVIGICILILVISYVAICSDKKILPWYFFLIWTLVLIYAITFSITYTINIVKQIIKLYRFKNKLDEIENVKRTILDDANEIRIDILIKVLHEQFGLDEKAYYNILMKLTENAEFENKNEVLDYFKNHYDLD